ncbi:hypothetical protein OG244_16005 [Streptomyces brevispora]|uniref:hypothetical protein n=1 Tax=Streptomyces brevispora TaxID=887462 RepID=UPI002E3349B2|nr:hypothetical protein [Streptomyces brevispora]
MNTRNTDPARHPRTAADAIRKFNHATLPTRTGPAIAYPGTLYNTIGSFATLAHRLPQALDQIGRALADLHKAGHLTADHGTPTQHADDVSTALREAERHATAMTEALERAHNASGPLGYCGPIDDTDDDL